jgi:hypothetical protein
MNISDLVRSYERGALALAIPAGKKSNIIFILAEYLGYGGGKAGFSPETHGSWRNKERERRRSMRRSLVLTELEKKGSIQITGGGAG